MSFNDSRAIVGEKIIVGSNVTPLQECGKVVVKKNAQLILKGKSGTILERGFECEKGARLTIE